MILDELNKYRIILASSSPRRQQLLKQLGIKFDIVIKDYNETYPTHLAGEEIAMYLAREKANSFRNKLSDNEIVITADTIVWCNNRDLGKPSDTDEARQMIRDLSGNTHEVITGVFLISSSKEKSFSASTKVTFATISEEEINYYIKSFKPYDKAGAYGIQDWIGLAACNRIEGCYFNVVGLPVQKLYEELKEFIK